MILAISTSSGICSCAIYLSQQNKTYISQNSAGNSQAESICSVVQYCLDLAKITWADISHIIIDTGPGSFTGIRVGTSYVDGINSVSQIKITGISVLQALLVNTSLMAMSFLIANKQECYYAKKNNEHIEYGVISIEDLNKMIQSDSMPFITNQLDNTIIDNKSNNVLVKEINASLFIDYILSNLSILNQEMSSTPFYIKPANIR